MGRNVTVQICKTGKVIPQRTCRHAGHAVKGGGFGLAATDTFVPELATV